MSTIHTVTRSCPIKTRYEALVLEVLAGVDTIYLTLIGVPSPFPQDSEHSVKTRVDAPHGTGAQWVRDNFGIEPRIIEG